MRSYPFYMLLGVFFLATLPFSSEAAFRQRSSNNDSVQELLGEVRYELRNREEEGRYLEEKLSNQQSLLDSLMHDIEVAKQENQEAVRGSSNGIDTRLSSLEKRAGGISEDLKQLQSHANETGKSLAAYQKKIQELERDIQNQRQNLTHMETAMASVMQALGLESDLPSSGGSYKVKSGDSLDKIAKKNNTTITKLKEYNNLKDSRIFVGQTLKLP